PIFTFHLHPPPHYPALHPFPTRRSSDLLGNALYFPFHVGASTVLYPGRPEPAKVFEIIASERPTLFFAVPTAYAALLQVSDAERAYDLRATSLVLWDGEELTAMFMVRCLQKFGPEILAG